MQLCLRCLHAADHRLDDSDVRQRTYCKKATLASNWVKQPLAGGNSVQCSECRDKAGQTEILPVNCSSSNGEFSWTECVSFPPKKPRLHIHIYIYIYYIYIDLSYCVPIIPESYLHLPNVFRTRTWTTRRLQHSQPVFPAVIEMDTKLTEKPKATVSTSRGLIMSYNHIQSI